MPSFFFVDCADRYLARNSKGFFAWEFFCVLHLQHLRNAIFNIEQNPAGPVTLARNKFLAGSTYCIWKTDRIRDGLDMTQFIEPPQFTSLATRREILSAFLSVLGEALPDVIGAAEKGAEVGRQKITIVVADAIEVLRKRRLSS